MNILNSIAPCPTPYLLIGILGVTVLFFLFLPMLLEYCKYREEHRTYLGVTKERAECYDKEIKKGSYEEVYKLYKDLGFKESIGMDGLYWSPSPGSHDYIDVFEIFINEEYYILNFSDWKRLKKKIGFW